MTMVSDLSSEPATPTIGRSDRVLHIMLVDQRALSRNCAVAGLSEAEDLLVTACSTLDDWAETATPDLLLIHNAMNTEKALMGQIRDALQRWPAVPILTLIKLDESSQILGSIRHGVLGLITSETTLVAMINAIRMITSGFAVFPQQAIDVLRQALNGVGDLSLVSEHTGDSIRFPTLTPRQREVLELLALGSSNKVIAQTLGLSESTVKVHIKGIMEKARVSNRTQIVSQLIRKQGPLGA